MEGAPDIEIIKVAIPSRLRLLNSNCYNNLAKCMYMLCPGSQANSSFLFKICALVPQKSITDGNRQHWSSFFMS
jgi:hypothetical protein